MNTRTLRHLIREYEISYKLPGTSSSSSASDPNARSRDKLVTTLKALLGITLLTQGLVFFNEQRDAISTFGSIIKALAAAAVGTLEERVVSRVLLEAEETYKTAYGPITSAEIGKLLKSNVDKISSKKNYLNSIPAIIDSGIVAKFNSITDELSEKLDKLDATVTATDKQTFPNIFSAFGTQPDAIKTIEPSDVDTSELKIANSAMTDACAVAYYNSIHNQIESYLRVLEELSSNDSSIDKKSVKDHVTKILKVYDDEISDNASKILTGNPS
jgi:hypothetical protein